jgi:hypothetical protein
VSIQFAIATTSSNVVAHRLVLSNSTCILPQNASITALSKQSPTDPNDGVNPDRRRFSPQLQEVNCVP